MIIGKTSISLRRGYFEDSLDNLYDNICVNICCIIILCGKQLVDIFNNIMKSDKNKFFN